MPVQRRDQLRQARVVAVACVLSMISVAVADPGARGDLFDDLYHRGQEQNGNLRTLTAAFTETTTSALLTRPLTARGTVAVARPSRVALRYSEPDERLVIIDGARLTVSWPSRGVRQARDIGASQQRVQKYFVNSSPAELRRHFDIAAHERPGLPGYVVTMVPTRKQIAEGLSRLDLSIDADSLLMTSMKMTFPNGDSKEMTFTDVRPNAAIDPAVFRSDGSR
jgi:outer membrane lipoprotein-sorting protein